MRTAAPRRASSARNNAFCRAVRLGLPACIAAGAHAVRHSYEWTRVLVDAVGANEDGCVALEREGVVQPSPVIPGTADGSRVDLTQQSASSSGWQRVENVVGPHKFGVTLDTHPLPPARYTTVTRGRTRKYTSFFAPPRATKP